MAILPTLGMLGMNVRVRNSSDERFKEPHFHLENEPSTVGNGLFLGLGFGVHGMDVLCCHIFMHV